MNSYKKLPVVLLGGSSNALAISRSLGRSGVPIYISQKKGNPANYSKYVTKRFTFREPENPLEYWKNLLLEKAPKELEGAIIFPCNDPAIEFVCQYYQELKQKYRLDEIHPDIQLKLLNKLETLRLASKMGIPHPNYVEIPLDRPFEIPEEIHFPLMVRPEDSFSFRKLFNGQKLFIVKNKKELERAVSLVKKARLKTIACEMIPGPDALLGSYYTYIDENGRSLFHYTKRVLRRFPKNRGLGCYHITKWDPEVARMGQRFFEGIGFRGLGNIEFKRDIRDGKLKIIECNCRFTAAHELLIRSGLDIGKIIYNKLIGKEIVASTKTKDGVTLWYPFRDFQAYLELRGLGELTFFQWIRSVSHKQIFPFFKWSDPLPVLIPFINDLREKIKNKVDIIFL